MNEGRLDELFMLLGIGFWNWIHYVIHIIGMTLAAPQCLGGAFLTPDVDYLCVPAAPEAPVTQINGDPRYEIYLEDNGNNSFLTQCFYSVKNLETGHTTEEACTEWIFDNSTFTSTFTSEYQLACDRAYLRATYQSLIMVGMFFGATLCGFVADRYGRKKTIIIGFMTFLITTNASCWITNLTVLLFFRFLIGCTIHFFTSITFIQVVEITKPSLRPIAGILATLPWAFGSTSWGGVAYFIRDWRWLQFAVSIPGVLVIPFLWFMDESPRWFLVAGYTDKGLKVIKRAARLNKKTLPSDEELTSFLQENEDQKDVMIHNQKPREMKKKLYEILADVFILFRTPKLRRVTLACYVTFLLINMIYFGLSLSGGNLSENPFLFMILSGLVEFPAFSLTAPIVARFGRRRPCMICFAISGVTLLAIAPTPHRYGSLILTLAMVGKFSIASAYGILNLFSNELFPTEVRSRGFATSYTMSRIGSIISPFITDLLAELYPWAPVVIFGASALVVCLMIYSLPETKGVPLPDTVTEFEERHADN